MSRELKILIIRFSSFGDIIQAMGVLPALKQRFPNAQIDWVARKDFSGVLETTDLVTQLWRYDRETGLIGLIKLGLALRKENYDYIYDAHANLRSAILSLLFLGLPARRAKRSKERWKRFLYFKLKRPVYQWPYRGMLSYLRPLLAWGLEEHAPVAQLQFTEEDRQAVAAHDVQQTYCLVPSAAWPMKRWPLESWKELVRLTPEIRWTVLGGPADDFCQDIAAVAPERVNNLAGKLSLKQSCLAVQDCRGVVSADTGLLHVADLCGVPGIALIGPTAFGHPTRAHMRTLETQLPCKPCTKDGRGRCTQSVYQRCMVEITPEMVRDALRDLPQN